MECRFGDVTVNGSFDNKSRTVRCIAPAEPADKVTLELSLYGDTFGTVGERITNQVKYDYYVPETALWMVPAMARPAPSPCARATAAPAAGCSGSR